MSHIPRIQVRNPPKNDANNIMHVERRSKQTRWNEPNHKPSEIQLMFSNALVPDLKGENATSFTSLPKRAKSVTDSWTSGNKTPTSSCAITLNIAYPAACSNSTYRTYRVVEWDWYKYPAIITERSDKNKAKYSRKNSLPRTMLASCSYSSQTPIQINS